MDMRDPVDLQERATLRRPFFVPEEPAPARPLFPILHLDEIQLGDDPIWLVDGLLPCTGLGMVVGPPKSLKSFLLADCLLHVAMGREYAGRSTLAGAVVYVTGEGVEGFKRRLIAMRRHYDVEGRRIPFLMIPVAPDFGHAGGDDQVLIATVRQSLAAFGNPPVRAIAIDTLARSMKGADENAAKDMTAFVDNCGRVGAAFQTIVIGVHHAGKDVARGPRGSNALDGAVDVLWTVEKGEASSTATIHYMKDGPDGTTWQFRLAPYMLGQPGAARPDVAAAVVEIVVPPGELQHGAASRSAPPGKGAKLLLEIIDHAIQEMGEFVRGDANVPHDTRSITIEDLKRYLPLRGYQEGEKPSATDRANLSRDLRALRADHFVGKTATHLWRPSGPPQQPAANRSRKK